MTSPAVTIRGTAPVPRYCSDCGQPFWPRREDQEFCRTACRQAHHGRRKQRGLELYDLAMAFRRERRKGGFTEVCRLLDDWIRQDRLTAKAHRTIRKGHEQGGKE